MFSRLIFFRDYIYIDGFSKHWRWGSWTLTFWKERGYRDQIIWFHITVKYGANYSFIWTALVENIVDNELWPSCALFSLGDETSGDLFEFMSMTESSSKWFWIQAFYWSAPRISEDSIQYELYWRYSTRKIIVICVAHFSEKQSNQTSFILSKRLPVLVITKKYLSCIFYIFLKQKPIQNHQPLKLLRF